MSTYSHIYGILVPRLVSRPVTAPSAPEPVQCAHPSILPRCQYISSSQIEFIAIACAPLFVGRSDMLTVPQFEHSSFSYGVEADGGDGCGVVTDGGDGCFMFP